MENQRKSFLTVASLAYLFCLTSFLTDLFSTYKKDGEETVKRMEKKGKDKKK